MSRGAIVAAAVGGTLAVAEGLLLIALGGLAGLADNPDSDAARSGGYAVLLLGAVVLTAVFVARRSPFVLATTTAVAGAVGFLVENALWVFAAAFLFTATVLGVISGRSASQRV